MDIVKTLINAGIDCQYAACVSKTKYVCYNTSPEMVNAVLKSINIYPEFRAFWSSDSIWDKEKCVHINQMCTNGKSWD